MTNLDRVETALRRHEVGSGLVVAPVNDLAAETGLSPRTVQRTLGAMIENGALAFTGKRHRKSAIFRIAAARSVPAVNGQPPKGVVRFTDPPGVAGNASCEAAESDREENLEHARAYLDSLAAGEELGEPDLPAGQCDECGNEAPARWTLGTFSICRTCRVRRARAGATLAAEAKPELVPALVQQLDPAPEPPADPWADPDF